MSSHDGVEVRRSSDRPRQLDARRRSGELVRAHRGIYVPAHPTSEEADWLARLRATIVRAGPGAAASHRAAARLHGLDGFAGTQDERHIDVIAPVTSTARGPAVTRSRTLQPGDITVVDGMAVTTIERTLLDLGTRTTAADLEIALESALRGPDPKRPDIWHQDRLASLHRRVSATAQRSGIAALRRILQQRRPGARPTGSRAETVALLALRAAGFHAYTQARIRIVAKRNTLTYWADLADLDRALVVEIDGLEHHATPAAQDRDHQRQNIVTEALTLIRFSASAVLHDADAMVRTTMRRRAQLSTTANNWTQGAFHVTSTGDGWAMTYTSA